jgi:hypothetical protein
VGKALDEKADGLTELAVDVGTLILTSPKSMHKWLATK